MEPVFENRYYSNHSMLSEFFRKYTIGPRPTLVIRCAVIVLFFYICSYVMGVFWEVLPTLTSVTMVFGALYFLPDLYARISHRNVKKQNNGILPETIVAFGDAIEMREGMVQFTLEYEKVVSVIHLEYSYVLMVNERNGIILDPNGFTKGSFEEFKQFLREKRPDLNIPE